MTETWNFKKNKDRNLKIQVSKCAFPQLMNNFKVVKHGSYYFGFFNW
jgi:hypothetical protein